MANFEDKEKFFAGLIDDFQYIEQYGVDKTEYFNMIEKLNVANNF